MLARRARPAALLLAAAALGAGCRSEKKSDTSTAVTLAGSKQGLAATLVDFDGDGAEDKLVGAPYAARGDGRVGAVLVYPATADGFSAEPAAVLTGDDQFGFTVAEVGDLDGDGHRDLAVGAIAGDGDVASLAGSVTLFRGGSGGGTLAKLAGELPLARFGYALAAADFDGDGHRDLAVGAPFHTPDPSLFQQGAVYVFLGPDFARRIALYATGTARSLGWSVAAGDVNADGRDDLFLGASAVVGGATVGKVLGFYGSPAFAPSLAAPDVVVVGKVGSLGRALAVVGDVDGDALPDLAVGAPGATFGGGRDAGSVYLVRGGAGPRSVDLDAATADASLLARVDGAAMFTRFGASVAGVGDLDADGLAEVAVGAPLVDLPDRPLAGGVYLFKGKDLRPGVTLAAATAFGGVAANQGFGTSLWPCGGGRLLIGAPRRDADAGGVAMVDLATGGAVPGGGSGGVSGEATEDCH